MFAASGRDLRYALRSLRQRPGFTIAVLVSLALGIGANTTIFTFLNAVFLRSLPVRDPGSLFSIYSTDEATPGFFPLSYPNFDDLAARRDVFADAAAYQWIGVTLARREQPERIRGQVVSPNFFTVLGIAPRTGRAFAVPEERDPVVVAGSRLVERLFGDPQSAIGRVLLLNGRPFTVVGVMPPTFNGIGAMGVVAEFWVPVAHFDHVSAFRGMRQRRGAQIFGSFARLAPGYDRRRAEAVVQTLGRRLRRDFPDDNPGLGFTLRPLSDSVIDPNQRPAFLLAGRLLLAISGLLLLVACANVAILLLVRASARRREIAMRLALGAGASRLTLQLITESVLLAVLGGLLALPVARWSRDLLWSLRPSFLDESAFDLGVDWRVVSFALLLSLTTGVITGLVPALQARRPDLIAELRERGPAGAGRPNRLPLRGLLLVVQIAFCLVAVVAAALFRRSLESAWRTNTGFATEQLLVLQFDLGAQGYGDEQSQEFVRQAIERVSLLPGVAAASVASSVPLSVFGMENGVRLQGREETITIRTNAVELRYFATLGIPIVRGRDFNASDRAGAPLTAVINRTMADRFWPGGQAVGRRFYLIEKESWVDIVGVAADTKSATVGQEPQPYIYLSLRQVPRPRLALHVRTLDAPERLLESVRREIQALDSSLPLTGVETLSERLRQSLWAPRMAAALLTAFGLTTLLLVSTGIYTLVAYSVHQRWHEIGVRMSLGARRRQVRRLFVQSTMGLVTAGMALGLLAALGLNRLARALLYGITPADPPAFLAAALVVAGTAWLATWLSVVRAETTDIAAILRES